MTWPATPDDLAREQDRLAALAPPPWLPPPGPLRVGGCAVVFGRGGRDELAWAAAVLEQAGAIVAVCTRTARVAVPYRPGQLALREGAILEAAVRGLVLPPDVLLVAASGRDHPRRAGLAFQLGAVLDLPSVGVTDDPLAATGPEPDAPRGSRAPLLLAGEVVAHRLRTRAGAKPIVVHAGWRTAPDVAAELALAACALARWPEPLREARRVARELRSTQPRRADHD